MALYKQKGSSIWWYEFQFAGQRIRESTKTTDKNLAREAERARRRQLEESFNGIRKPEMPKTFSVAAEEFIALKRPNVAMKTMEIIERGVNQLLPFIGKKLLCDITAIDIQRIVDHRRIQGASNRYVNMTIETLRSILRRNHQWERLRPDYKKLKEPKNIGRALLIREEKELLRCCRTTPSRVLYPVVILGLYAGMRRDEIRWLQWWQVNLQKAFLTVGKSKTEHGENRKIPLLGPAIQAMRSWAAQFPTRRPDHYVFPAERYTSEMGEVYHQNLKKPMGSCRKAWQGACRRAGIRIRFHDLRHTTVTRLLEAGRTLEQIAPIMGWSADTFAEMMLIYADWSLDAKRKTMSGLVRPKKRRRRK